MSIAARIVGIVVMPITDQGLKRYSLTLEPNSDSAAGQDRLFILNPPENYASLGILLGIDIWGGCSDIMTGETKLAERLGPARIKLVDDWYKIAQFAKKHGVDFWPY